jgi:hypothetical protein
LATIQEGISATTILLGFLAAKVKGGGWQLDFYFSWTARIASRVFGFSYIKACSSTHSSPHSTPRNTIPYLHTFGSHTSKALGLHSLIPRVYKLARRRRSGCTITTSHHQRSIFITTLENTAGITCFQGFKGSWLPSSSCFPYGVIWLFL